MPVELGEGLALRLELLDDRLDHEIAVGEVRELGRERQPADRGVALLGRHLPFLDGTAEVVLDLPRARSHSSSLTSRPTVSKPAWAATCAIPAPIVPRPTTPTLRICTAAPYPGKNSAPSRVLFT